MTAQVVGGVDQGHVGEGLGEVAHLALGHGVVFLGQQTEVVAEADQTIEQGVGVVVPADQVEAVGQPEGTGQEGPLVTLQAVHGVGVGGPVAQDEAVLGQVALDGLDGGADPVVGGREETDQRAS